MERFPFHHCCNQAIGESEKLKRPIPPLTKRKNSTCSHSASVHRYPYECRWHLSNLTELLDWLKNTVSTLRRRNANSSGHLWSTWAITSMQQACTHCLSNSQRACTTKCPRTRLVFGHGQLLWKISANLSTVLHPVNELLQQGRKWEWLRAYQEELQTAKDSLLTSKVVMHYDPAQPIKLAADASGVRVGAVNPHTLPDGTERPVAFASSEHIYAQIEKEALTLWNKETPSVLIWASLHPGYRDHKPLLAILGPHKGIPSLAAPRLQRWALILAAYNYRIEFKPTQQPMLMDYLDCHCLRALNWNTPQNQAISVFVNSKPYQSSCNASHKEGCNSQQSVSLY